MGSTFFVVVPWQISSISFQILDFGGILVVWDVVMVCQAGSRTRFRALKYENGIAGSAIIVVRVIACFQPLQDCQRDCEETDISTATAFNFWLWISVRRQFDWQSHNLNSLAAPHPLGQQRTNTEFMNFGTNMVSTTRTFLVYANTELPQFRVGQDDKNRGRFYCLPHFRQVFVPGSNSSLNVQLPVNPSESQTENITPKVGSECAQKRFLVFDQSGGRTVVFSYVFGTPIEIPTSLGSKIPSACNFSWNDPIAKVKSNVQSGPISVDAFDDNCPDVKSEMHEDTEELNAMLYSDDSDDTDDDEEVASEDHSPSAMMAHYEQLVGGTEDFVRTTGLTKKRKLLGESNDYVPLPMDPAVSANPKSSEYEDDADSSCANGRKPASYDVYSSSGRKKIRKDKICDTCEGCLPIKELKLWSRVENELETLLFGSSNSSGGIITRETSACPALVNHYDIAVLYRRASSISLASFDAMSKEIISFYSNLIGTTDNMVKEIDPNLLKELLNYSLPSEDSASLVKEITREGIQKAIFCQGNDKAPGPDSFTPYFFKNSWNIVGEDVVAAVKFFFLNATIHPAFNSTIIALVPKIPYPSAVKDYQSISCCYVIYKIITKIIIRRLTNFLHEIITLNQTAFIRGRSIIDNTLLAQEMVKGYGRKSISPRCALKIDLHKAFDSIHWGFILQILKALQLPHAFIAWIEGNIESVVGVLTILDHFYEISGLKLNLSKFTRKLIEKDCQALIDNIKLKLHHWTGRNLSYAGILELIRSVLATVGADNLFCQLQLLKR
ncbi:Transcription factor, putative isoform 2 [Hibiscus syriacus]|uniref:Transcription factor, putative isoform 2 n=1 Tax=Hibiscus syriacus TaxID=106335 RepID=A0A6A2WJA6_HIBSY|nr:Transcription factor, putative isoform 2 [Hibiscus syriacus]